MKNKSTAKIAFSTIGRFLFLSGAITAAILFFIQSNKNIEKASAYDRIIAVVVDYKIVSYRGTFYAPVYKYNINGTEYTYVDEIGSTSKPYAIGESVTLYVAANNPEEVTSKITSNFPLVGAFFFSFLAFVIIIGMFVLPIFAKLKIGIELIFVGLFFIGFVIMATLVIIVMNDIQTAGEFFGKNISFVVMLTIALLIGGALITGNIVTIIREIKERKK